MTAGHILVVEDNPTARKLYRITLQSEGYDVVEASDATSALECLARDTPALVLLDLFLPDSRGLDLLKQIREQTNGRELPIVALSGFRSILEESKMLPLGFDATLVKPVDRANLLATVRSLLPEHPVRTTSIGQGHRILVVDDDSVQLKLVRLRLLDAGFEVTTASGGAAALAFAARERPALVLADVLMPEMDGFELCAAMRGDPALAGVPVVLMSAHFVDESDGELARRVGAHSLVLRSPALTEVLETVARALEAAQPTLRAIEFPRSDHKARLAYRLKQLAVLNAALLQRCAQQAAQLSIVGGVADALARSENVDAVLQDILSACLDAGGISKGALLREDVEGRLTADQSVGFSDVERSVLTTTLGDPAIAHVLAAGKPVALSSFLARETFEAFVARAGVTSSICLPIMVEEHCRAALLLGCGDSELSEADLLAFGRAIVAYVGQALTLSDAFARLNAVAEANRILFASLEIDKTLRSLGQLVIARIGELCEIDLVEEGGRLRTEVAVHSDPARADILTEMHRRYPPRPDREVRYQVLRSMQPYLCSEKTDAMRAALAEDAGHLQMLRAIGLRSHMVVPLVLKGRAVGVLSIGTSRPGRRYGRADLALAEELAGSAAVALENARLYHVAQAASLAKDEFLATVSHELRTPLNSMLGWTRLLRSGSLPSESHGKALASIERNALAQTRLVADILDVSGIVAGKLKLAVDTVRLSEVVDAALDSVRLSMDAKAIRLELHVEDLTLACDPSRLQQVIWNLVSNAIKFTPKGGDISLSATRADSHAELCVKDSGRGIAPGFLPHVFERFQQADGSITRAQGGLGLGLAISRHIVELHGGTIEAHSDGEGKGALFRVKLPSASPAGPGPNGTPRQSPPPAARPALPQELLAVKILVVDDDPDARELMTTILEGTGAKVTVTRSAQEALSHLNDARYDVLVSDVGMPEVDGLQLIRALRAMPHDQGGSMPALAVTAYASPDQKHSALRAGYQMHLEKPVDPGELARTVASLARMAAETR